MPEQPVQVPPNRFRVPNLGGLAAGVPYEEIVTHPPFSLRGDPLPRRFNEQHHGSSRGLHYHGRPACVDRRSADSEAITAPVRAFPTPLIESYEPRTLTCVWLSPLRSIKRRTSFSAISSATPQATPSQPHLTASRGPYSFRQRASKQRCQLAADASPCPRPRHCVRVHGGGGSEYHP